jgi:NTP pyrophosphatase (non-canonical NTP hydrolase)
MSHTLNDFQDMLTEMFGRQKTQQEQFGLDPKSMTQITKAKAAKDLALGLYEEVGELVDVITRYKAHVLKAKPIEHANVLAEVTDVMKYLVAVAQLHDLSAVDLYESFMRKSDVVDDRARCERIELAEHTKVIITDLDGCVVDLGPWQSQLPAPNHVDGESALSLESLKDQFYRNGGFLNMEPIVGAVEGLKSIRTAGYKLVIITARPNWQHKRLYADTMAWLRAHGIEYDQLLFAKDKADAIIENIFPAKPLFFIEDRPKHALEVATIGVPVMMLGEASNELTTHPLIHPVTGWDDIVNAVLNQEKK